MNKNSWVDNHFVPAALILGLALILTSFIAAGYLYKIRSLDNTISVVGSAKQRVTANSVKWTFNISRIVSELNRKDGYAKMEKDTELIKKFLSNNLLTEKEYNIAPIMNEEIWHGDNYQGPRESTLREQITIQSDNVKKITDLANRTKDLVDQGVFLSSWPIEYYYSNLSELRVSLLSKAIEDAKARATEITKTTGKSVGDLKSAASGVVQVLAPNSVDVSDYGQYDTTSLEKDIMVTVRAAFFVK